MIERTRVSTGPASAGTATLASLAAPILVELDDEPMTQGHIQIIDARSGNRVVTVIEVLSPANKRPGQGQEMFLREQQECQQAKINNRITGSGRCRGTACAVARPGTRHAADQSGRT